MNPNQARFDALATALAHELRSPLSTITMTLELLREELAGRAPRDTVRRIDSVLDEIKRLDRTFGDFLRYARDPDPDLRPADVNRLVEESLSVLANDLRARRLTPVLQLDRRAGPVLVDESLMRQALLCVLHNVIGTFEGGTVTIQTRASPKAFEVDVIDTGPGPSPEVAARMFDSWFTSASGRSGVGLALARQIVELHHGRIAYERAPGSGNRFAISLPLGGGG
jgi:two-component system, NtrC family, sensor kinase